MAENKLAGVRLDLFSRKDGLVYQSDLGQNKIEIKGLTPGTTVKTGDYKVAFEDTKGNMSKTVDVPGFTVKSAPASGASTTPSAAAKPTSTASSAASSSASKSK